MNNTPVYVYVKQCYDYHDLSEIAVGRLSIQHLIDLKEGVEGAEEAIRKELNATDSIKHSFSINLEGAIQNLMNGVAWSEVDDVGYIAFSLTSTSDAKKEVERLYLQEEGLGDE